MIWMSDPERKVSEGVEPETQHGALHAAEEDVESIGDRALRIGELIPALELDPGREAVPSAPAPIGAGADAQQAAAAIELARDALAGIARVEQVGEFAGFVDEGDGVYSARFATLDPAYPGWYWTVSLLRLSDAATPTVLELELLPGDGALIAPAWVPWTERFAEYEAAQARAEQDSQAIEQAAAAVEAGRSDAAAAALDEAPTRRRLRTARRRVTVSGREPRRRRRLPTPDANDERKPVGVDADGPEDPELPVAADIREFADDMDDVFDGVEFEPDPPAPAA